VIAIIVGRSTRGFGGEGYAAFGVVATVTVD